MIEVCCLWITCGYATVPFLRIVPSTYKVHLRPPSYVLYISIVVHIFSISYMNGDPHNQRFFSYLSLFTFFMIILVTGGNYLIMFIG